jgi:predicted amidophosphoribosyltransferase
VDGTSDSYVAAQRRGPKRAARRGAFDHFASVIWPQRSLLTGREVPGPGPLEPEAWSKLQFLSGAVCARCGTPFEIAVDPGQLCGACIAYPPAYDRARAALVYGDVSRDLVLALKR